MKISKCLGGGRTTQPIFLSIRETLRYILRE